MYIYTYMHIYIHTYIYIYIYTRIYVCIWVSTRQKSGRKHLGNNTGCAYYYPDVGGGTQRRRAIFDRC